MKSLRNQVLFLAMLVFVVAAVAACGGGGSSSSAGNSATVMPPSEIGYDDIANRSRDSSEICAYLAS